jgi:membrane associated rhomboid family serine protease
MLLPIGDEPNDPRVPWMNYTIIGANVVVFVLIQMAGNSPELFFRYGYIPQRGGILPLFTCLFMHDGFLHIGGNMLFLWIFGDNVEARLGPLGYLAAYLGLGVVATLVFGAFNANSAVPLVGASGAISGVQGLYFVACPRHRVKLFVFVYFIITVVHWNARWVMAFWFVMQDLIPSYVQIQHHTGGHVAHMAHVGGFVGGLLLMLLLVLWMPGLRRARETGGSGSRAGRRGSGPYLRQRRYDPYVRRGPPPSYRPPPLPPRHGEDDDPPS